MTMSVLITFLGSDGATISAMATDIHSVSELPDLISREESADSRIVRILVDLTIHSR